jgi:hypothetical protein
MPGFLGGIPKVSAQQIAELLSEQDRSRGVFVACSGSYRIERTLFQRWPEARIYSNDVTFFSSMLGKWLSGQDLDYRFKGELAPLGDLVEDASPRRRMAAVAVALDMSEFGSGTRNLYKARHLNHILARLPERLDVTEAKLAAAFGDLALAGFHCGDLREQIAMAVEQRGAVVTFPPFFKNGYERLYRWLDENVDWPAPTYPVFEPKDLETIFGGVVEAGVPYVIGSGRLLERPERPAALFTPPTKTPHYLYAPKAHARLIRNKAALKPFRFKPLDPARLGPETKVTLTAVDGARAMYVRGMYLKKSITPAPGRWNFLIYLDDMLAGVLVYDVAKFGPREDSLYLLSDVSTTREGRVSKLIARLALNAGLAQHMAGKALKPLGYVVTTAFSDHPVSMKYRGVFELLSRKPAEPPMTGFQLQYGQATHAETPQAAYAWWWSNHGNPEGRVGAQDARGRGRGRGRGGR